MLIGVWAILLLFLFTAVVKRSRRLLYDGFVISGTTEELLSELRKNSAAYALPERRGRGADLGATRAYIMRAYRVIERTVYRKRELNDYERRLYDNHYLIDRSLKGAEKESYSNLPHAGGVPRIITFARTVVAYGNCKVDRARVELAVNEVNKISPFTTAELNRLRGAFTFALLEKLAQISRKCVYCRKMFHAAVGGKNLIKRYLAGNFYLLYAVKSNPKLGKKLGTFLDRRGNTLDNLDYAYSGLLIENNVLTENALDSLNKLGDELGDTTRFNLSDAVLKKDATYLLSDGATRQLILNKLATESDKINQKEAEFSQKLLELSQKTETDLSVLLFEQTKRVRHYASTNRVLTAPESKDTAVKLFVATNVLLAVIASFVTAYFIGTAYMKILVFALTFLPYLCAVRPITEFVFKLFSKPRNVFKCDYAEVPDHAAVTVVMPVFVSGEECLKECFNTLSATAAVNGGINVHYVLLADFPSADTAEIDADKTLIALSQELSTSHKNIFFVLRKRTLNDGKYSSYERKRGALIDFSEMLNSGDGGKFRYFTKPPKRTPYVIVLDADNTLPPGAVLSAVNAVEHPINRRYDLLAFSARCDAYSLNTPYSKRYAQSSLYERYPEYSEFSYALCGYGSFTGKGIYRLSEFCTKLKDALPDGKILSHDAIEGALLDTGIAGVTTYEDAPESFNSEAQRSERWRRGDLQNLPFICLKTEEGKSLPLYNRYGIFLNALCVPFGFLNFLTVFVLSFTVSLLSVLSRRPRYALKDVLRALAELIFALLILPYDIICGFTVTLATLVRMAFTKKNLLNWKPYCSSGGRFSDTARLFAFPLFVVATIAVALYGTPYFWAVSAYFWAEVISIPLLFLCGNRKVEEEYDSANLRAEAQLLYRYFNDFSVNGLISDNFQTAPKGMRAEYTSPTNVGFSLMAEVSAYALGLIDKPTAENNVQKILDAVSRLKTWNGHLYNWYDVTTCEPKTPFVSSVDSGNYLASLIVVKEVFKEKTAKYVENVFKNVNFSALFDYDKEQFYIGVNTENGKQTGHYDNLISEARLLAYVAISSGFYPKLWSALTRTPSPLYGNTLLSFGGTAFEYLMPTLFLRPSGNSSLYRSERNAAREVMHVKCGGFSGISESGYFEFDENNNYQYKAFGLSKLAEKSELNSCVISPYSSYLCFPYERRRALKNLNKLKKIQMLGNYGYYEALDYSGDRPYVVLENMAHHQGMSLTAIANLLCGNYIVKAFNADFGVRGARQLLTERMYEGYARSGKRNRFIYSPKEDENYRQTAEDGEACVLKNGGYGLVLTEDGRGYGVRDGIMLNRFRADEQGVYGGFFYVSEDGRTFSPTRAPLYDDCRYETVFTKTEAEYINLTKNVSERVYAPNFFNGELRKLTITNDGDDERKVKVAFYTELSLNDIASDKSHRAFYNLFVQVRLENGILYATRNCLDKDKRKYAAMKLKGFSKVRYIGNRFNFIGRGRTLKNPQAFRGGAKPDDVGTVLEPCLAFTAEITVPPKSSMTAEVAIALSDTSAGLEADLKRASSPNFSEFIGRVPYLSDSGSNYALDVAYTRLLSRLIPKLLYESYDKQKLLRICNIITKFNEFSDIFKRKVLLFKYEKDDLKLKNVVRLTAVLRAVGIHVALLISFSEYDDYYKPQRRRITENVESGVIGRDTFLVEEGDISFGELSKTAFYVFGEVPKPYTVERASYSPLNKSVLERGRLLESGEGYYSPYGYEVVPFGARTALPYSNVIAGRYGGTVVTDSGGYTFFGNSREERLTEWSNDAVLDTPSELLCLETDDGKYRLNGDVGAHVTHGLGFSSIFSATNGFSANVTQFMTDDGKCKVYEVEIYAEHDVNGRLTFEAEPVLGGIDKAYAVYYNQNCGFTEAVNLRNGLGAYLKVFGGRYGDGFDAEYDVELEGGQRQTYYFVLSGDFGVAEELLPENVQSKKAEALEYFRNLNKYSLKSGDDYLDALFNALPYQTVSCRINGRTSFYQAGGAVGFRDSMQDVLALIYTDAHYSRELILNAARHVYYEGDVMHWWHGEKHGVRTRISDDGLFLPYAVSVYVAATGDRSVLDEELPYLISKPLITDENSRYENPSYSLKSDSLLLHLERIVEHAYRVGDNGLLLIGGGDWNDALDGVGNETSGESVWLTMFYCDVLTRLAEFYVGREKLPFLKRVDDLRRAVESTFTGTRYKRLITKDGEWLGDGKSAVASIDVLTQAWAELSGVCNKNRVKIALETAKKELFDEKNGLVLLLKPPFNFEKYYGYISSYPEGVRENGGQYTHGAVWLVRALISAGMIDDAYSVLSAINPVKKCADREGAERYKAEPYVLAADVYSGSLSGRAGWSWYTGSASWCYKTILEGFFGVSLKNGRLFVNPRLPEALPEVTLTVTDGKGTAELLLKKCGKDGFFENGVEIKNGNMISFTDGEVRKFEVWCK